MATFESNAGDPTRGILRSLGSAARRMDLLVDGILGLELDGEAYHNNAKAFEEDLRRGNVLVIRGIPTLRIPGNVVLFHPKRCSSGSRKP